jgi:hypothetical protein
MYDVLDPEKVIENIEAVELPEDLKIKLSRAMEITSKAGILHMSK